MTTDTQLLHRVLAVGTIGLTGLFLFTVVYGAPKFYVLGLAVLLTVTRYISESRIDWSSNRSESEREVA